jgi:sn-glycerol 3-phosphate transport system ATP-binding protein
MSVFDNMAYGLKNRGMPKTEIGQRIAEAARLLDIEPYLTRRPRELSGGQRQRVAMGRAIVRNPQVFLFDEPLSNLDAKLRVTMRMEIRRLHDRLKATSIFVTHDQVEAMTLADTVVVMNGGAIEQIGTPAQVYREPATTFVAGFIGSPPMNILQGEVADGGIVQGPAGVAFRYDPKRFSARPGDKVQIGVRAEDLTVVEADASGVSPGRFTATTEFVEELGASRVLHTRIDGLPLAILQPASTRLPDGPALTVSAAPEAVQLFDPAGRRL